MSTAQTIHSLPDLARWWLAQMRAWMPARASARQPQSVVLRMGHDGAVVASLSPGDGSAADLATLSPALRRRIDIVVPDGAMIETTLELPNATERQLHNVLRFEIDRLTPFAPEEIHFSGHVARRRPGRITACLRLVPRQITADAEDLLERASLRARAIVTEKGQRAVPLGRIRRVNLRRGALLAIAAACAVAILPFGLQEAQIMRTQTAIDRAMPDMDHASQLRLRLERSLHGPQALITQARTSGHLPELLTRTSDALPDDTYLTGLAILHRHLEFSGVAADAPALIARLDAAGFANAALSGPVLRTADGKRDAFTAHADGPSSGGTAP